MAINLTEEQLQVLLTHIIELKLKHNDSLIRAINNEIDRLRLVNLLKELQ